MTKLTILDTDYATLWYHTDDKIVQHVYHKFIYGKEFRDVLNKGVELLKEHGATKWLSDDRKNSALPTEDLNWSMTEWFPKAFEAGWRNWAIIMPDKVAGQMNMNRIMKVNIDRGLNIKVFEDTNEALEWLKSIG
ncbi:MAG: STAS/SEC14 domain-containing protein [Anaerolineae bacterium]|nr:STAS/SEC14 domain-containing protein [Anaerolineae bacterium]